MNEELLEYKCPHCGAEIVGQGSYAISENDDGYYVAYACGRYDAEVGECSCPSDPSFPKLGDYEFQFAEHPDESTLKWSCLAKAKTSAAMKVHLQNGMGRTRDEARQQVIDNYARVAKPWR